MLDLTTLRVPTFAASTVGGSVYRAVVSSAPFLLPLLLQVGFGWSPVRAGAALVAVFAGNLAVKPLTTPLMRRVRLVPVVVGASAVLAATFVGGALLGPQTPVVVVVALFAVSGAARSVGFTAYGTLQFADVPAAAMGASNTVASMALQLATGLGVAGAALVVRLAGAVLPGAGPATPYRVALVVAAAVGLLSVLDAVRLPRAAGDAVRAGRR